MSKNNTFKKIGWTLAIFLVVFFVTDCGEKNENIQKKDNVQRLSKPIKKNGNKDKGKKRVDIDKLKIPDRMKTAVKSGKISMEQVNKFLKKNKGTKNAPLVHIEKVARKNLASYLILNGTVEPERLVKVYSRLQTYVKKIDREEGDFVKRNSVMARLDDQEIRIAYQQAKIQLEQAQTALKDEENNFNRNRELKKSNLISEQDFQTVESKLKTAGLEYKSKLENYKNLQLQLNYTKIKSPVEGYITERLIEVGDKVNSNQHVYTVEDFNPLLSRVYVPSSDSSKLERGMKAEITSDILTGQMFKGKVKLVNPRIDVQSGTVKVTIEIYDRSLKLKPGMFVEVRIVIGEKKNTIVIPRKSIVYKQEKTFVYVVRKMQVFKREINLGVSEEDQAEVINGLDEGEMVVTIGVETLKDKMRIRVDK
ncbi:MAG: efflux RND transporter periplasmic adaptor subunit [Acidobacteriota bacterium]